MWPFDGSAPRLADVVFVAVGGVIQLVSVAILLMRLLPAVAEAKQKALARVAAVRQRRDQLRMAARTHRRAHALVVEAKQRVAALESETGDLKARLDEAMAKRTWVLVLSERKSTQMDQPFVAEVAIAADREGGEESTQHVLIWDADADRARKRLAARYPGTAGYRVVGMQAAGEMPPSG